MLCQRQPQQQYVDICAGTAISLTGGGLERIVMDRSQKWLFFNGSKSNNKTMQLLQQLGF
jgi:hypothetical protein